MDNEHDVSNRGGESVRKYQAQGWLAGGHVTLPNVVVRHVRLSGNAKAMWAILYDLVHFRQEDPELLELGKLLGGGEKTARSALRELQDEGLVISKRRGQGLTNLYMLTDPPQGPVQNGPRGGSRTAAGAASPFKDLGQDTTPGRKPPGVGRKRNPLFDALVEATAANPDASGGMIGTALKAILLACAPLVDARSQEFLAENPSYEEVPAERVQAFLVALIHGRAERYREMRPDWELTPTALASHWNRIPTWETKERGKLTPSQIASLDLDAP